MIKIKNNMVFYLKAYIKEYVSVILFYFLIIFFFIATTFFDHKLIYIVKYVVFISVFWTFVFGIIGFRKYYKKILFLQKEIENCDGNFLLDIEECGLMEELYLRLAAETLHKAKSIATERDIQYKENMDYYNLWIHEVKNPIFALKLFIQSQIEDGDIQIQFREEVFHIEQYIEMSLNYLRIESLSNDLEFLYYDLLSIVKESIKKYSIVFINKNIDFTMRDLDAQVLTDKKWFSFILEQVLSNSLKYTKNGSIEIFYEKDIRKLSIKDTGIGIASGDLNRIFEKSFTGYNGRNNKQSTGMGLYLCKKVANQLYIELTIISKVGVGTTMGIKFNQDNMTKM